LVVETQAGTRGGLVARPRLRGCEKRYVHSSASLRVWRNTIGTIAQRICNPGQAVGDHAGADVLNRENLAIAR
jgi:hypothetical protein